MTDAQMPESLKVPDTPHGAWLWDFLDGTSGYMGVFFGEPHPKHGGRYWWRRFVREEVSALQSALKDRDAEIERLKKDAERFQWLLDNANIEYDPSEPYQLVIWEPGTGQDWKAIVRAAIDSMNGGANG